MRTELTELGLEVQNLQKVYKGYDKSEPVFALKNLSLQVKKGSLFVLRLLVCSLLILEKDADDEEQEDGGVDEDGDKDADEEESRRRRGREREEGEANQGEEEEEEEEEEEKDEEKKEEHDRGFRRDTNTQEILSSLLMFCFFALCFVCPLPVLLMWTPRPAANVHKGLTHTHNLCEICTQYVSLVW